ncbi:efflux transporter outer membrane subunit [Sphingobium limneticum]|uniref:Efflux transporter outer membrane subunit n=1 Tax=Sphingobium limneticum TaxID=1007511 RepID=A0A5J5HWL3_9SPHN|nr:efflux transporter outer membrane subunit [Sphingobium limneticum]KAA9014253.1 efflux transporter outer membrane subunit [Sphingobium limneticum]KAA9027342.1 efflux transporter outer membrane subunit [Sphingobium limneticum]
MKRNMKALGAVTLSLALAACDMAPKYVRPELPVPAGTPQGDAYAANAGAGAAIVPADTAWRDFFTDARLARVIETALANNRDLRIALANVEQARAQYKVQRADLLPTVAGSGTATYSEQPLVQFGQSQRLNTDVYQAQLGISSWEIDLFGRVRNLTKAAQEQYFASVETRNAAQTALIAETANAWLTMAADQERLRIAIDTEKAFGKTLELNKARFDRGIASELEVRQAQTSYDGARSDIAVATTLVAQDQNALNLLAGTTVSAADLPNSLEQKDATLDNLPANISSDVLLRRPDIASAEHNLLGANANIGAARAAFFPTISLTAALGTVSLGLSGLFKSGSDTWSVAPGATLPIFDFGRNKGNLRYARATYDAMLATYEKSVQTGFREVADALARRGTMTQQVEAQTSQRDSARVAYTLSEARFRAGVDSFLTTLDSQRSLYSAEQSLVGTRLTRATNMVELYRAMGGGLK